MGATLDIYGMYRHDATIFENMQLPSGVDSEIEKAHIMMKCQDLEILYPEFNSLKAMIGIWSSMNIAKWNKLFDTLNYEYDPLRPFDVEENTIINKANETITSKKENKLNNENEQYNRSKEHSERQNSTESLNGDSSETYNGNKDINENTIENKSEEKKQGVAAFNSATREPTTEDKNDSETANIKKNSTNQNDNTSYEESTIKNNNEERNYQESSENNREKLNVTNTNEEETMNENGLNNRITKTKGNMGSNTFQDLIQAERDINEFNIYEYIAESFKQTFCVMVY